MAAAAPGPSSAGTGMWTGGETSADDTRPTRSSWGAGVDDGVDDDDDEAASTRGAAASRPALPADAVDRPMMNPRHLADSARRHGHGAHCFFAPPRQTLRAAREVKGPLAEARLTR